MKPIDIDPYDVSLAELYHICELNNLNMNIIRRRGRLVVEVNESNK